MIYKDTKVGSLNISISSIKINTHVYDKNVETIAIMIEETKN